jgi:hypothetical protein
LLTPDGRRNPIGVQSGTGPSSNRPSGHGFFEDGPEEGVTYYDRMLRFANDLATD